MRLVLSVIFQASHVLDMRNAFIHLIVICSSIFPKRCFEGIGKTAERKKFFFFLSNMSQMNSAPKKEKKNRFRFRRRSIPLFNRLIIIIIIKIRREDAGLGGEAC